MKDGGYVLFACIHFVWSYIAWECLWKLVTMIHLGEKVKKELRLETLPTTGLQWGESCHNFLFRWIYKESKLLEMECEKKIQETNYKIKSRKLWRKRCIWVQHLMLRTILKVPYQHHIQHLCLRRHDHVLHFA